MARMKRAALLSKGGQLKMMVALNTPLRLASLGTSPQRGEEPQNGEETPIADAAPSQDI
ncbi:hypothetical protein [Aminobacter sp. HY435]|uniref:hypothetical protein n=1 Tax=Aminobacter sp. HY435 TaxID=2970917 RepID=UPI0022B942F0|nr:hypothetical protein [Aminobacter sp. HY435]